MINDWAYLDWQREILARGTRLARTENLAENSKRKTFQLMIRKLEIVIHRNLDTGNTNPSHHFKKKLKYVLTRRSNEYVKI